MCASGSVGSSPTCIGLRSRKRGRSLPATDSRRPTTDYRRPITDHRGPPDMRLADPHWLWLLAPLFAAWIGVLAWTRARRPRPAATFVSLTAFTDMRATWAVRLRPWVMGLRYVAVGMLLLALARPVGSEG